MSLAPYYPNTIAKFKFLLYCKYYLLLKTHLNKYFLPLNNKFKDLY